VRRRRKLRIITLVRDPVGRNVSRYFHDLHYWLAYYFTEIASDRLSGDNLDVLIDCFRKTFNHRYPLDWFDKELKRLTGLDIYGYPFDTAKGCTRIDKGRVSLLIVQTEKLRDCWRTIEEFCDSKLEARDDNRGERKWYGALYSEFLDRLSLTAEELDEMYSSKYATFFFSEETRAQLKKRWQGGTSDAERKASAARGG
jgi:hypothetical protein